MAGRFICAFLSALTRIPFTKLATSLDEQLDLLQQRGMEIMDRNRAAHYLRFIGYYHLSGYWFPFQYRDTDPSKHDNFQPGTDFDTVLDRYIFDRKLRILLMDALEQIEIAVRAIISDMLALRFGPHWFLDYHYAATNNQTS